MVTLKRVVFAKPAQRDLAANVDYISLDNPRAAERVYRTIVASTESLIDFPDIGRMGRLPDTRELQVTALPYMIAYQVDARAITVLAIFHGARDLKRAFAERGKQIKR